MTSPGTPPPGRRWDRQKIDLRLKIITQTPDGHESSCFGRGHSLSMGGLGAYIPTSIPLGSQVALELAFSHSSDHVKIKASVRSAEGFKYGLEFIDLPLAVRDEISRICAKTET